MDVGWPGRPLDAPAVGQEPGAASKDAGGPWCGDFRLRPGPCCGRCRTPLDAHNVRRGFRRVAGVAGLTAKDWTPRELRHSFVSLLSDDGMPIEHIARLVGHTSTAVTETVYRQQIRPVIIEGAEAMDRIFTTSSDSSDIG
jgi:integrase